MNRVSATSTATPDPKAQRANQLRTGTYNNTAICIYDGRPATTAHTGKTGNRYGTCADCTDATQQLDYRQAAVYVTNRIEAEAVKTEDPAETLGNILDALPEVMPAVFQKMGTAPDLAEVLRPEVTDRVRALRDIYHARATATGGMVEIWDIILDAIRKGHQPANVTGHVVGLMEQARAVKAGATA